MADWTHEHRRARKPQVCSTCQRTIDPGEIYRRGTGFDAGSVWNWNDCEHCAAVVSLYDVFDWDEGGYSGDTFESWIDYRIDAKNLTIEELRAMAGFRKRWRTASGRLWPVPIEERAEVSA